MIEVVFGKLKGIKIPIPQEIKSLRLLISSEKINFSLGPIGIGWENCQYLDLEFFWGNFFLFILLIFFSLGMFEFFTRSQGIG